MRAPAKHYNPLRLDGALVELETAISVLAAACPRRPRRESRQGDLGLVALKRESDFDSATLSYDLQHRAWVEQVERTERLVGKPGSKLSLVFNRTELAALLRACDRQRKKRGGSFADPLSRHWFLLAVVRSLQNFEYWGQRGTNRKQITKADWEVAAKAVGALLQVVRRGIPVGATALRHGVSGISESNLFELRSSLEQERGLAKKTHADEFSAQRDACREFAKYIYISFDGEVPPSWVEGFGQLIGYRSEKIQRTYVRQWVKEFARVMGRPGPPAAFVQKI